MALDRALAVERCSPAEEAPLQANMSPQGAGAGEVEGVSALLEKSPFCL